jgi:DNA polymerase
MNSDIIDKTIAYFEFQKEVFDNNLLIELAKKNIEVALPPQKENIILTNVTEKPIINDTNMIEKVETVNPDWDKSTNLEILYDNIHNCKECKLGLTRKSFVFGSGNPNADILIIGEAPGAEEDEQGLPFVGRAGQLLTKILESINLSRDEVYIANIVKCRPPNNRKPEKDEVDICEEYLKKQIELINPAFILSLGLTSVDSLLKKVHKMGEIRGKVMDYHGKKLLVTYHPAALLRNPNWKKLTWEDMKYLRKLYDEFLASK